MADETTIYLVRHGATAHNESRPVILQGCGVDGPLSETGRRQADSVGAFLAAKSIDAIYSSPMRRARETAEAIAQHHPHDVNMLKAIHEVNVGDWEGKTWPQIMQEDSEQYARFMERPDEVGYRGGESYTDVLTRVRPVIEQTAAKHPDETIVIVAHNVVNRVIICGLLSLPLAKSKLIRQDNCCVNVLRLKEEELEVLTVNSGFHLRD